MAIEPNMGTIMPELGMHVNASLLFKRADRNSEVPPLRGRPLTEPRRRHRTCSYRALVRHALDSFDINAVGSALAGE